MTTREQLKESARALGMASAEVGDTYDVLQAFAAGYAEANGAFFKDGKEVHYELSALDGLQKTAEEVIQWRVDDAREAHMSWDKIAEALDTSRQAVERKYGTAENISFLTPEKLSVKDEVILTPENLSIEDEVFLVEANLSIEDFREFLTEGTVTVKGFEEHKAWWFLNEQRVELHNGTLTPERRAFLDEQVPGWDDEPAVLNP